MHKQIVIIGAGPAGVLLARMLLNRGIDCLLLENRNEAFLRKLNRGGSLAGAMVEVLKQEKAGRQLLEKGIPLQQIDFNIDGATFSLPLTNNSSERHALIYDQGNLVADIIDGLKADQFPLFFEAKGQRFEGLNGDKVRVIYTLNGQIQDLTCDFIVGCDGFRGISRRNIPSDLRQEQQQELPLAWLEWIVDQKPASHHPIIALHQDGFAMQSGTVNGQTRYYLQVKRGTEMADLPPPEDIWENVEKRLGKEVPRGKMHNQTLDYMRLFYTKSMQHKRLFIAGDAAHQVPRLGSKSLNLALSDVSKLAVAFSHFYNDKDESYLKAYTKNCLAENLKTMAYAHYLNHLFHHHVGHDFKTQVKKIREVLTDGDKQRELINFLIG